MQKTLLTAVTLATLVGFGCKPKSTEPASPSMSDTTTSMPAGNTTTAPGNTTMGTSSNRMPAGTMDTSNTSTDMTPKDNGSGGVKENPNRPNK